MDEKKKKLLWVAGAVVIALLSALVISHWTTSTSFYQKTIARLDQNKKNVLELMTASTAASAAITLLPGDVATPIAEQLADISSDFLIVLSAIYLEKFLLTIIGFISFVLLIPASCVLSAVNVFLQRPFLRELAKKLLIFALLIFMVIPVSVFITNQINDTYGASISETIEQAKNATDDVKKDTQEQASEDEQGWWQGLISSAKNSISTATKNMELVLNKMIDALAILIVTSCIIPILVILLFIWLAKVILHVEVPDKDYMKLWKKKKRTLRL